MCCQKLNNEARQLYYNERLNYSYICGPYINLPCCCGYGFHFELLFLQDKRNRDYVQYMDISCFKIFNNLFPRDSYEPLPHLDSNRI